MRQDTTVFGAGTIGNSQAQNAQVATLALPSAGRWKLWGTARHTLADGLKVVSPVNLVLVGGPNDTISFGPILVDLVSSGAFTVQLNTATGASDTAGVTLYAEKVNH